MVRAIIKTHCSAETGRPMFLSLLLAWLLVVGVPGCGDSPAPGHGHDGAAADTGGDTGHRDMGSSPDAGRDAVSSADGSVKHQWIGPKGGTVDLLKFAVFGDVRPRYMNQDSGYPVKTVRGVFTRLAARGPQFVLGVGDWMFASNYSHASAQLTMLLQAEKPYAHQVFHAMGNHECNGWTSSNCPRGNETGQVRAYFEKLLPFTKTAYFKFIVNTRSGSAKFVVVAPNAWDKTQESWLKQTMKQKTRYTFVLRHEPPSDTRAPGVKPSQAIFDGYPHTTLFLYGHNHEYKHLSANQVISGNGGAPLSHGSHYGYLWVTQLPGGNLRITERRSDTDQVTDSFNLTPGGQLTH